MHNEFGNGKQLQLSAKHGVFFFSPGRYSLLRTEILPFDFGLARQQSKTIYIYTSINNFNL